MAYKLYLQVIDLDDRNEPRKYVPLGKISQHHFKSFLGALKTDLQTFAVYDEIRITKNNANELTDKGSVL